jgi:Ubiquitin-2 like Rad60 SUMO-like
MASTSTSASTTKKSFFKKPTWATSVPPTESRDFFRHSDTVYDSILREKERRRRKHAQKKQANVDSEVAEEGRENKRRRITTDDEDEEYNEKSDSETASIGSLNESKTKIETIVNEAESSVLRGPTQSTPTTPSNTNLSLSSYPQANSKAINLEADEENSSPQPSMPRRETLLRTSDDEISEEDDEYVLTLKQKAREKVRGIAKGAGLGDDQTPAPGTRETQQRPPSNDRSSSARPHAAPTNNDETIVQILITTKIPNAKPLIVNRKVSQPMQHVREVWCSRQNFGDDMTGSVIFTWRGKRLYDTSTSTHLLNVLRKERACRKGGLIDDDEEDPSNGRIEVEAITKVMFEQQYLRKSQEEDAAEANDTMNQGAQDQQPTEGSTTPKEQEYKVVMKAQGMEALHLKVRPGTKISKMMAVFKKMRLVDPGKTCWFVFDGDRLEPDSTVGDTDIEDGDAVEVHVR